MVYGKNWVEIATYSSPITLPACARVGGKAIACSTRSAPCYECRVSIGPDPAKLQDRATPQCTESDGWRSSCVPVAIGQRSNELPVGRRA